MTGTENERRTGAQTRVEILRVAAELFTEKGFEGTSTRDISTALGITKSSLYYHFKNKDEIAQSLTEGRRRDVQRLLDWITEQPRTPDLLQRTALRWIDATTEENLQAMRLAHANQPMIRRMAGNRTDVRTAMEEVVAQFVDDDTPPARHLMIRMAFNAPAAALLSAQGADLTSADIIAAARQDAIALTDALHTQDRLPPGPTTSEAR